MTQSHPVRRHWDVRVEEILKSVRRRGTVLMLLGYGVYGGGSAAILTYVHDKALATVLVMYFFQLMVLYFGTKEMYPAIQGAFRTALEANRDSVPLFETLADGVNRLQSDPANHPLVKTIGDRAEKLINEKLMPVVDAWARIGDRLEKVTIPQFEKMIAQCGDTERKLDSKVSAAVEDVRRVHRHIEGELATGLLTAVRETAEVLKLAGMQHAAPPMPSGGLPLVPPLGKPVKAAPGRDFSGVLAGLSKSQNGAPATVASQGGRV
jgi:hypothetical protein